MTLAHAMEEAADAIGHSVGAVAMLSNEALRRLLEEIENHLQEVENG